ncbi:DUF5060 domain-containing protein [Jiulongibacter sediminis]|jgi:hypothetical protein|uniref:DUF5060 domain-containing protein n=1 Tax=Jiulongibacter sediminis TaxID=1605367 RepID=UPI0026EB1D21|nr:DUF5060 domain-containing protein [Jiulongibacter sediminis]
MNRKTFLSVLAVFFSQVLFAQQIHGDLQKWHKITIDFEGPLSTELANPNPFTDYRLDVTFRHESGAPVLKVPGFFAADGQAEHSSATSGNVWRVHFAPPKEGQWKYEVSFKFGEDIVFSDDGVSAGYMDGQTGKFTVQSSDKQWPDNRSKGRLEYVGTRYLKWAETGKSFLKTGADSPENALHYEDFDGTLDANRKLDLVEEHQHLLKDWQPHARDYESAAQPYTWQNGKGKNILGMVNYLAETGVNAFSFLTFSADGDDGFVHPYVVKNDSVFLANHEGNTTWENALYHDRFDVSKMAQWENLFSYADMKGMFLHFKTFENENVGLMGMEQMTNDRKLYYRELIARFAHHLALNWNLSEETKVSLNVIRNTASYIRNLDPYKNHVVQHTFPIGYPGTGLIRPNFEYYHYNLFGFQSELTGLSLQLQKKDIHEQVKKWVKLSEESGKPWAIANDEQGDASDGVTVDKSYPGYTGKVKKDNAEEVRYKVLWATLMAGGYGTEYYYGYQTELSDLTAQDHRSREVKYQQAVFARQFFEEHLPFEEMHAMDDLTDDENDYVFAKEGEIYTVYIPDGETVNLKLPALKGWSVQWFNPRTGELGSSSKVNSKGKLNPPDKEDWVALVKR